MAGLSGATAIVGAAESDELGKCGDTSNLELHAQAARNALADAGLTRDDVDGLFCAGESPLDVGEYLQIFPRVLDGTSVGGSSFLMHVAHAASAIATGRCEVALITHGEAGYSGRKGGRRGWGRWSDPGGTRGQFQLPYGHAGAPMDYAIACTRHMHEYGTTHEQLAEIAVATRKWAAMNPKALYRDPLTVDDVLASRWVHYPFHLLDCCLVTDAGGAVVVTSAERARDLPHPVVRVLGVGESMDHGMISQMPSLTSFSAVTSGREAFAMAGVTRDDIDVCELYDSFTYTVLLTLEDLGFCAKGEGGAFVSGQRTAPGGDFPMNTQGGGLSYTHSGMFGIFTLIEGTRQLRHAYAEDVPGRQVANARIGLCHGTGGNLSSAATVILERA